MYTDSDDMGGEPSVLLRNGIGRTGSDGVGSIRLEGMPGGTWPEPPTPLFQLERAESVGWEREAETFREPVLPNSR